MAVHLAEGNIGELEEVAHLEEDKRGNQVVEDREHTQDKQEVAGSLKGMGCS